MHRRIDLSQVSLHQVNPSLVTLSYYDWHVVALRSEELLRIPGLPDHTGLQVVDSNDDGRKQIKEINEPR
jgi:hypothetical protein